MRLTQLDLRRSRGLRSGFCLDGIGAGINVIVGPNASGKTSLTRAVRALLWEDEAFRGEVRSSWEHDGQDFEISRETSLPPSWSPSAHPDLPEARFSHCFTLSVDDFLTDKHTDREIAREIKTELSAGFDLALVMASERRTTAHRATPRAQALRKSREARQGVEEAQRELAKEERGLALLEEERDAARAARDLNVRFGDAVQLADEREKLERAKLALEELPEGMQQLDGHELERLELLREQLDKAHAALRKATGEVEFEREAIDATALEAPIRPESLQSLTERDGRLTALEAQLKEARAQEGQAAASLSLAQRSLFELSARGEASEVGRERWNKLEGLLRERDAARVKLDEARAQAQLAEPVPEVEEASDGRTKLIAIGLIVLGAALGLTVFPFAWSLAGAGVVLLIFSARRGGGEAEYAQRRAEERKQALSAQEARLAEREAALGDFCSSCGLTGELGTLTLTEIADRNRSRSTAEEQFATAQAAREEANAEGARELFEINRVLEEFGVEAVASSVDLRRAKEELTRRSGELCNARDGLASAEERLAIARGELDSGQESLARFYAATGLGAEDERELARRLERFAEYQRLTTEGKDAARQISTLESRLAEHPELLDLDVSTARAQHEENMRLGQLRDGAIDQIARIENQVKEARAGSDLEEAMAAEELALQALEEVRDELFEGAAAEFLLDSVQEEHRAHAEPDILRRASEWFARFTSHAYSLQAPPSTMADGPGFTVRESSGGEKLVSELSSGTLAQLQLALRLAVAQESERGVELPLFLDEALSNTDPVRFAQVASSLGELARSGRQVFFLASSPDDVQRLAEALSEGGYDAPTSFDLGALRGEAAAASLARTPLPEISAPRAGELASDYGERMQVGDIDPFLGIDALHLFYVLHGDLTALHSVLEQRVTSVGEARQLFASQEGIGLDAGQRTRFSATCNATAAWFDAYKIGRGTRLTSEALREGPVSSTKYIEDLVAINAERGGDARALLRELGADASDRDPRLKGFRKAKIVELAVDLEQRGHYSAEEPLEESELRERSLASSAGAIERGELTREDIFQHTAALAQWLGLN